MWSKVFKSFGFIAILCCIYMYLTYLCGDKVSYWIRDEYYSCEEDIEVFFLGTSRVYDAIYPMELYRDYGIASYNFGSEGERMAMTYYVLLDALQYKKPKVLVIDVHALMFGNQKNDPEIPTRSHVVFDAMHPSYVKYSGILDTIEKDIRFDFLCPLNYYHNRWNELEEKDFQKQRNYGYGSRYDSSVTLIKDMEYPLIQLNEDAVYEDNESTRYLKKIIETSKREGIDVILTYFPYVPWQGAQLVTDEAYAIAREEGVPYINGFQYAKAMNFSYDLDTKDGIGGHLNPSGARKVTKWYGNYLRRNYVLSDFRKMEESNEWNKKYFDYQRLFKNNMILNCDGGLELYLTYISDPDYNIEIYVNKEGIDEEELYWIVRLVDNAKKLTNIRYEENAELKSDLEIVVSEKRSGQVVDYSYWNWDSSIKQALRI